MSSDGTAGPRGVRANFGWNLLGVTMYYLSQWLLLVVVARLVGAHGVGEFALALAISAPVYLTLGLNLRLVRATDVARQWSPAGYSRLRLLLNVISLAVSLLIGFVVGLRGDTLLTLVAVCLAKATEATSQLKYGYFQLRQHLAPVGRSLVARAIGGLGGMTLGLVLFDRLPAGAAGMALGWFVVYLLHDATCERRLLATEHEVLRQAGIEAPAVPGSMRSLATKSLPLGLDAGVGSIATNMPRYAVQYFLGTAALGVFAPLAYLAQVVSFVTGALGDAVLGRLAQLHHQARGHAFGVLLGQVLAFGVGVALCAVLGAWLVGEWLIGSLMGPAFVDQPVLIVLMLGAGAITFQRSLARALYASLRYSSALLVNTLVCVCATVLAWMLVPAFGLVGAAATVGFAFLIGSVVTGALLWHGARRKGESPV